MNGPFELSALPWFAAWILCTQAVPGQEQETAPAELVTPTRLSRLVAAPDGGPIAMLEGRRAWVLDGRELAPQAVVETGPYLPVGDPWSEGRFSADAKRLALWSFRGSSACVDVETGHVLSATDLLEPSGKVLARVDGAARLIAQATSDRLVVRSTENAEERFAAGWPKLAAFALSGDGRALIFNGYRGVERVLFEAGATSEPTVLAPGHWDELALLPGGATLLLLRKAEARCIDVESGAILAAAAWQGGERKLQGFDRDGSMVLLATSDRLQGVSTSDLSVVWEVEGAQGAFVEPVSGTAWTRAWQGASTVLDVASGELLWTPDELEFRQWFTQVAPGRAGELLAVRRDGRALVALNARTGARTDLVELATGDDRWTGVFPDGKVWVASARGAVSLLDPASGARVALRALSDRLKSVSASASGLVVHDEQGRAHVLDRALEVVASFEAAGRVLASADGRCVLSYGAPVGGVRLHAGDGELLHTLGASSGEFDRVACDRSGDTLAALGREGALRLFRGRSEVPLETLGDLPLSISIDPDGRFFAVGFDAPRVEVFDTETGWLLATLEVEGWWPFGVDVRGLEFDPRGEFLVATTGDSGSVHVWRTAGWERAWTKDYGGGNPSALALAFDDVARRLWVSGMTNHTQAVYDLGTGARVADLAGTDLAGFAAAPAGSATGVVLGLRRGGLVLLESDGRVRLERLDLGPHGVIVSAPGGNVYGDALALRRAFVRVGGGLERADRYVAERGRGRQR